MTSGACRTCGEPPFDHRDFVAERIGTDETEGRFGEVRVDRCRACGRLWLVYTVEFEGFAESGRWFRGEIAPDAAAALAPEDALGHFSSLEGYFAGGSYYRSTGHPARGEVRIL